MYVAIAIVRAVAQALEHRGVPVRRYCDAAGFDHARLADPTAMVPMTEYAQLLRVARQLADEPGFGLRVGERAPTGALHIVGYLMLNCRTMRDAIEQFVPLTRLVFEGARFELGEQAPHARFSYEHAELPDDVAAFDADFCLAFVVGIGRHFAGWDTAPVEVRVRHPRPGYLRDYARVFRCPIAFDQPRNEIVFRASVLDVPQIHRDEPVAELLRQRASDLLAERESDHVLAQRVVDLVKYQPDPSALDAASVSRRLGVSPRTLRRRLAALDLSLSSLVERGRCELASAALAGQTPIKEIAERLGFSEPSAFHRAFKRWTGRTPAQYRQAARDGRDDGPRPLHG